MRLPKLSKLELKIMEVLWSHGPSSIREIQEKMSGDPAYSTVQTMVYRLEVKKALRRAKKISNAHIFEAVVTRESAQRNFADEFLRFFGGMQPVMAHLIESGKLTMDDIQEAERALHEMEKKGKQK